MRGLKRRREQQIGKMNQQCDRHLLKIDAHIRQRTKQERIRADFNQSKTLLAAEWRLTFAIAAPAEAALIRQKR
jgi:hypothetical protein